MASYANTCDEVQYFPKNQFMIKADLLKANMVQISHIYSPLTNKHDELQAGLRTSDLKAALGQLSIDKTTINFASYYILYVFYINNQNY